MRNPPPAPSSDPAVAPAPQPVSDASAKRVYLPADFARFAPQTAYDMLTQVPGFTIKSAEQERGLGQASENVLINGERIANKSGGAIDELRKVPAANVERIEIVDAASLGIAGLVGQVANVIVKAERRQGPVRMESRFPRAFRARPTCSAGRSAIRAERTGSIIRCRSRSDRARRRFGGPVLITDGTGALIERATRSIMPKATSHGQGQARLPRSRIGQGQSDAVGDALLGAVNITATAACGPTATTAAGDPNRLDGFFYDISGDYDFRLGPGAAQADRAAAFRSRADRPDADHRFDSGAPDTGILFGRNSYIGETVGRAEYAWKSRQERAGSCRSSAPTIRSTSAVRWPTCRRPAPSSRCRFPGGSGKVEETRYEGTATLSRPLGPKLDLQVVLGAEQSTLARVDGNLAPRKFFRPKGSISLGWRPSPGWDASLKLRRRVGQISFYDFLSQPNLSQDRQNAGNPDLVPPQSWELEGEIGREFGPWGKTRLRAYAHRITDIIDIIPIGASDEGVGNLPSATRFGIVSTSTIQFDPIGWRGAKLDATSVSSAPASAIR